MPLHMISRHLPAPQSRCDYRNLNFQIQYLEFFHQSQLPSRLAKGKVNLHINIPEEWLRLLGKQCVGLVTLD